MPLLLTLLNLSLAFVEGVELELCNGLHGAQLEDLLAHDGVLEEQRLLHELITDLVHIKALARLPRLGRLLCTLLRLLSRGSILSRGSSGSNRWLRLGLLV